MFLIFYYSALCSSQVFLYFETQSSYQIFVRDVIYSIYFPRSFILLLF